MRRRLLLSLAWLAAIGGLAVAAQAGLRAYAERPIAGRLTFAPTLGDQTFAAGAFTLRWEAASGGRLVVTHQADPQRELWASVSGVSFVAAARGRETVEEARGSFFLSDTLEVVCADQALLSVAAQPTSVAFSGTLQCGGAGHVAYTLTFTALSEAQLGFALTLADPTPGLNRTYLTYASRPEEHFFGFGEQFSTFDLKGRRLPLFIMEQGIGRGAQPITLGADLQARAGGAWHTSYAGVPHYLTSDLRSLFLETYAYAVFDLRQADRAHIQLWAPALSGRILYGASPADLIRAYTDFAGRMRPLPDWIVSGAVVGMQGGTQKVRDVWAQLQAVEAPVAAFWLQDWVGQRTTSFGRQLWWNWELDQERYAGWDTLRADLEAAGVRVLVYVNPFLADVAEKPNARRNLFREAQAQNFLVRRPDGQPYLILNTSFSAGLVDLTNPQARDWMKGVLRDQVLAAGASGWMADFGEALPYDAVLASGEAAAAVHNRYPEDWARLNREVVDEAGRDDVVFFMRAGYRRSPAYATLFWAGDQLVSWDGQDGIKTAVTALLSSGLSGYAFNHSDIGGYTTITSPIANYRRDQELLLRWMELNAFTTLYRTHEGNRPDENVQFYSNAETLAHFSRFAQVYQAWGGYRRVLVQEAAATGLPVVRPPFIHYPDDPAVYRLNYQQFMVGSEFMVAPVLDPGKTDVAVYLPAGRWVHVWSGQTYGALDYGGTVTVPAPLGQPAVFYRAGSTVGAEFAANLRAAGLLP